MSHQIYDAYIYDIYDPKVLSPGDHICSFFETDEQQIDTLIGFIKEGLENNEKIFYFTGESNQKVLLHRLSTQIKDLKKLLSNGQIVLPPTKIIRKGEKPFSADKRINLIKEMFFNAAKEGYPRIRAAGNMNWALAHHVSMDDLIIFEARLNRELFGDSNCIGLCQYDMRRFSPKILHTQIDLHPVCHVGNEYYPNQFYIPPESYLSKDYETTLLQHKINQIKERKRREKHVAILYKQTEELREFSHLLVHDLKGPIISANTLGTMLKEAPAPEIIDHLLSALNQAKDRIESITQLNSISIGHKAKNFINLNYVLETLMENYEEEIKKIGGSIEWIAGDIKLISAHEKQMVQLFSNLIDNSIKYHRDKEKLKITITTQMYDNHEIKISIEDNGIGFPSYIKDKIFSPFFRSHGVLGIEGTGIGLTICQRILHKYNGRIIATGEEGKGAKFEVFLPLQ